MSLRGSYVIILAIAVVLLIPLSAFGAETVYWVTDSPKFLKPPTVCIYYPDEPRARDVIKDAWVKETEMGIESWQLAMKNSETRSTDKWNVDIVKISLEKKSTFDNSICRVEVKFTGTPLQSGSSAVGWEIYDGSKSQIKLFYITSEICGHTYYPEYDRSYPDFCFKDNFWRSKAIGNIAAHEFGHSIGLGHLQSSDPQLNFEWSLDPIASPSIMTLAIHYNEEKNQIRKIDVDKVKEIYGYDGFVKSEPGPLSEPESSGIEILEVAPYKTVQTKIIGIVPDGLYSRGTPAEIRITNPDGTQETAGVLVTSRGNFEYLMIFDSTSMIGKYQVSVVYNDKIIQKNVIEVVKTTYSGSTLPKSSTQSEVETTNIGGKYLENISIKSENNNYVVKGYFGKNFPQTSVRIIAENECPIKKEVFKKDFLIRSGAELSFSFYQLSEGKPLECSVHLTMSSFDGSILDAIKIKYDVAKIQSIKNTETENNIPDWIKTNVKWWSNGQIDDKSFIQGIQFLIKEGVMTISSTEQKTVGSSNEIPSWVRNTAKWWVEGQISEDDFVRGIEFLVQNGIIQVEQTSVVIP